MITEKELMDSYREKSVATLSRIRNFLYEVTEDDPHYSRAYESLHELLVTHYGREETT